MACCILSELLLADDLFVSIRVKVLEEGFNFISHGLIDMTLIGRVDTHDLGVGTLLWNAALTYKSTI